MGSFRSSGRFKLPISGRDSVGRPGHALRRSVLCVCALVLALAVVPGALAAPLPTFPTEASYKWLKHGCFDTPNGLRNMGTIRTYVKQLDKPGKTHYQEVKIQVDRWTTAGVWRSVASKFYSWSRFKGPALPTYSTSAIKTGFGTTASDLSVKATVRLRRARFGPDLTVWAYTVRSPIFRCGGDIGFGS